MVNMKSWLSCRRQGSIVVSGVILPLLACLCRPVDPNNLETVNNTSTILEGLRMKFSESYINRCSQNEDCSSKFKPLACKCDKFCKDFNDCCSFSENERPFSLQQFTECFPMGTFSTGLHVNLYSKCPLQWTDDNVRKKCENPGNLGLIENVFVSSRNTNLTYRNRHCARCHSVPNSELDIWKLSVTCKTFSKQRNVSKFSLFSSYREDETCDYKYVSVNKYYRLCHKDMPSYIRTCPHDYDGPFRSKCEGYTHPVIIFKEESVYRTYRNFGCLYCDDHRLHEPQTKYLDIQCRSTDTGNYDGLTITIDFSDIIYGTSTDVSKLFCKENEKPVAAINKCVELFCPGRSVPFFGKCIPYTTSTQTLILSILLHINGTLSSDLLRSSVESFAKDITSVCQRSYLVSINYIQISHGTHKFSNQTCMLANVNIELNFVIELKDLRICYENDLTNVWIKITDDIVMKYIQNVSFTECSTNDIFENLRSVYKPDTTTSDVMECPSIEVFSEKSSQVRKKDGNESRVFIIESITIDASYVYSIHDRFYMCLSSFETHYGHTSKSIRKYKHNYIVTYTCMSASVFSLFVALVHYIVIPNMIHNNSLVILHLLINIMLSQLAFLVSVVASADVTLCWWYGVLLHFLYLSMFASMSLSLLHINIQLRKMSNPSTEKRFCKVIGYFIIPGYIVSLIIVLVTTLLNAFVYPLQPWYGDDVCFISDSIVLLAAFACPVACSIVFNICVYASIVFFFHSRKGDKGILDINRSYFRVLIKLSTIMGSTWMIGFCAVFTRIEALEYIFEATSSLQGLFISVSLLVGQNVRNWYKQHLLCFYKKRQQDNNTATSSQ